MPEKQRLTISRFCGVIFLSLILSSQISLSAKHNLVLAEGSSHYATHWRQLSAERDNWSQPFFTGKMRKKKVSLFFASKKEVKRRPDYPSRKELEPQASSSSLLCDEAQSSSENKEANATSREATFGSGEGS